MITETRRWNRLEDDEFFPEWFRRRWRFPTSNWFEDFERSFEEMFRGMQLPKDLIRERKLPDGGTVKEMGPFVYGYSFSQGPDGKPVIREFGNVKPSIRGGPFGMSKPSLDVKEEREPLVDTIVQSDNVKVVAELPGVEKSDIALECDGRNLVLKVDTDTSKASYKNGVLELILRRKSPGSKAKQIQIE